MKRVKYHPFHPAKQFASLVDEFATGNFYNWINQEFSQPSVNVKESNEGYELELAAPGLQKSDFNIEIKEDQLVIKVSKESDKKDDTYKRREFQFNAFTKSFHLPKEIDREKINATYENGILVVTIPKMEVVNSVQKIEIG